MNEQDEDQLRETIEACLRSEFAEAMETYLEAQKEQLREEFEERLPEMLAEHEASKWETFEDSLGDAVEERLPVGPTDRTEASGRSFAHHRSQSAGCRRHS